MKFWGKPGVFLLTKKTRGFRWTVAVLCLAWLPALAAAGTRSYDGVTVSVEPPTDISSQSGYAVYRLSVSNRGSQPRDVTVSMPAEPWSYGDSIRRITRTVRVEPGSTAVAELLQPPLPMNGSDALVSIDGKLQEDWLPVALADHADYNSDGHPILISRGVDGRVRTGFETAMTEVSERGSSSGGYGSYGGYSDILARMARAERPVGEWSGNWLAFSRYLAVVISDDELRSAPAAVDAALRDYAAAGGIVVIVGASDTQPSRRGEWAAAWMHLDRDDGFAAYGLGAGRVQYVAESYLAGLDTDQWEEWVQSRIRSTENRRERLDANDAEHRLPMLETVRVPTRSLLFMMVLFTLLIGPVNIITLSVLKKRMWLLWTIPTIALIFAGGVLAYSIISEGIRPRAKTVAVTLLDQNTRQAVTLGMTGYYAPLTPGDGLRYDEHTEITPQAGDYGYGYGYSDGGRPRAMDLTNGQHLSSGWVIARVPAHFELRQVETRRERLDISRNDDGALSVTNGLGHPIKRLLVADAAGRVYEINGLAAGASGEARKTTHEADPTLSTQQLLQTQDWTLADNVTPLKDPTEMSPSTYVAQLDNASFLEPGLHNLISHEVTGVVVGRWQEAE